MGISKEEMQGVAFSWGTDSKGQLGLDSLSQAESVKMSLRVLYPRMMVPLKDELIKEICCGHCHSLAITVNG